MSDLIFYRKRIIPCENIRLDRDTVLYSDEKMMVTKWNTINPRKDIDHGYSLYLPEEGFKISKFLRKDGSLHKWYCDIVEFYFDKEEGSCTTLDLLLDVTINEKGEVHLLDMDELASAHKDGLISDELMHKALIRADRLLKIAYTGSFSKYADLLNSFIE